jgi:hypothetical protein
MKLSRPLAAALLALALAPLAVQAGEVWVAGATEKIRPDAKARNDVAAQLGAARNEFAAFQVVVTGPATHVSAALGALTGPGQLDDVKLYREDVIQLAHPSALDGGTGAWPDALVPDVDDVVGEKRNAFPFDVRNGESRAIWVEIRVPPDARPGTYQGAVTVTSDQGQATIPVALEVWDFGLPSTSSLRSSFGMSYGGIPAGHGLTGDAGATLRARYAQLALDHRITLTGMNDDGTTGLDHLDQFYGPLIDGKAPTRLPGAQLTAVKYIGDRTSADQHKTWAQHFRAKGWMDRLFDYTCDEPPLQCAWSDIPARTKAAHAGDPDFRTLVTTQLWDAQNNGGVDGGIDIMVSVVNWIDDKPPSQIAGDQRARYDAFLASGKHKELWLYQSCMSHGCGGTVNIGNPSDSDRYYTGWPSYMIDASAARNRAMEWISFLEDASGELYWETAYAFSHNAWSNQWDFSGNGDGTLFYPGTPGRIGGKTDIPVASLRLKMIRAGMQDYEYLKMLADLGDRDGARTIARGLFPNAYTTDVDPAQLEAARRELATRILKRTGKTLPTAGTTSTGATSGSTAAGGTTAGASATGAGAAGGGCSAAEGAGTCALLLAPALLALRRRTRAA